MSMLDLFTPASGDKSLQYLYQLFGDMNGLLGGGQVSGPVLFGELFRTFNTIALAIGTLIVVYTTIVGVLKTAAEGQFLGQQWNSLWIPLRMVLGIAALVPTPSGYSGLQIVMMWVIMQGVGAADQVWSTALRYVSVMGSPYTSSVNIPTVGIKETITTLFTAIVCDKSMNQGGNTAPLQTVINDVQYDYGAGAKAFDPSRIQPNSGKWDPSITPQYYSIGLCGGFTIEQGGSCPVATDETNQSQMTPVLQCRTANAQVAAVRSIATTLSAIADKVMDIDRNYQGYWNFVRRGAADPQQKAYAKALYHDNQYMQTVCDNLISQGLQQGQNQSKEDLCTSTAATDLMGIPASVAFLNNQASPQTSVANVYYPALQAEGIKSDFIQVTTNEYTRGVAQPVNDYLSHLIQNKSTSLSGVLSTAQSSGWIFAGAYYYVLSQSNNTSSSIPTSVTFSATMKNVNQSPFITSSKGYYTNYDTATYLASAAAAAQQPGGVAGAFANAGGAGAQAASQAANMANDTTSSTVTGWQGMMTQTTTDPVVALIGWGYTLLFLVPILWAALLVIFIVVSFVVSLSPSVLGTGIGSPGSGPYWTAIVLLFPLFFTLFSLLIGVGGLIGVYTPFVPYVIFIVGGLGWLISIVETMVAGPLVALGILAPGGHHDVLGKAEPALMLLFGNFLRPTLMIFGMFAAMLLAPIALDLLNGTFSTILTSITAFGASGGGASAQNASGVGTYALVANPVAAIFFLCVYVMLVIALLNKCFAAIHIIPERVMAWLSAQGAQYGEEAVLGEAKKGSEGAARGTETVMGEAKQKGGEAGSGGAARKKQQDKKDKKEGSSLE